MSDFNPRTREGCDFLDFQQALLAELISIHAPVKGATRHARKAEHDAVYFNPRTREGCDPFMVRDNVLS